jgi:carnitine-CoA ligase
MITDASGRAALDSLRSELPQLATVVMLDDDYAGIVAAGPPVPQVPRGPDGQCQSCTRRERQACRRGACSVAAIAAARGGIEPFTELYGQTECIPAALGGPAAAVGDPTGSGLPASDLELALLDDDECPVATGAVGEVCIRAPHAAHAMFDGCWDTTAPRLDGAWHHTGDSARLLASGALTFVDRKKDSLRRRGENVSSIELEAAIACHPDVDECAVHAVPSDLAEDDIKVCVVLRDGASLLPGPFFAFLQQQVPYFAVPRYVEIGDALPRNAVGQVMKHVLRERPLTPDGRDFDVLGLVVPRSARSWSARSI